MHNEELEACLYPSFFYKRRENFIQELIFIYGCNGRELLILVGDCSQIFLNAKETYPLPL